MRRAVAAMVGSSVGFVISRWTTLLTRFLPSRLAFTGILPTISQGTNGNQALLATSFDPPKRPVLWLNLKSGYSRPLTSINHKFFNDTHFYNVLIFGKATRLLRKLSFSSFGQIFIASVRHDGFWGDSNAAVLPLERPGRQDHSHVNAVSKKYDKASKRQAVEMVLRGAKQLSRRLRSLE